MLLFGEVKNYANSVEEGLRTKMQSNYQVREDHSHNYLTRVCTIEAALRRKDERIAELKYEKESLEATTRAQDTCIAALEKSLQHIFT